MFNLKQNLAAHLPTGVLQYEALCSLLTDFAWTHRRNLEPGTRARDLIELSLDREWIVQVGDGFEARF